MCELCDEEGIPCSYIGYDCAVGNLSLAPGSLNYIYGNPVYDESENMSNEVKVEVVDDAADKYGIITKQSEVYVWNDQVFASHASARSAQLQSTLYERLLKKLYPTWSAAQLKHSAQQMRVNRGSYVFYCDQIEAVFKDLLAEVSKDSAA